MLVALQAPPGLMGSELDVHNLPDRFTGDVRPYLVIGGKQLCEITAVGSASALDDSYHSFAVAGQYIVQNGSLHVITPVDPLFWLLRDEHLSIDSKAQWQPIDQILQQYDPAIINCIDTPQLQHVLAEMALSEDETYAKFSVDKALQWLRSKQLAVEPVLYKHLEVQTAKKQTSTTGGASLSGFTIAEDNVRPNQVVTEAEQSKQVEAQQEQLKQRAKEESIQVVCNYLSSAWRERFLQHLQVDAAVLESERQVKRQKVVESSSSASELPTIHTDWNDAVSGVDQTAKTAEKIKAATIAKPITAGAKRLLKANKKGLQKMSSFFGVKKKTK